MASVARGARGRSAGRRLSTRRLPVDNLPKVIPPKSVVLLRSFDPKLTPDWKGDVGRVFRVGYYRPSDGLDCIWLVNEQGTYEQSTDRSTLLKHFVILKLSAESDFFGQRRGPLKPLKAKRPSEYSAASLIA
jgi:hypothetical protein